MLALTISARNGLAQRTPGITHHCLHYTLLVKEDAVTGPLSWWLSFILSSVRPGHLSLDWLTLMPAGPALGKVRERQVSRQ